MTIDVIEELPANAIDSFVAGLSGALSLPFWSVLIIALFALACLSFVAYVSAVDRNRSVGFCFVITVGDPELEQFWIGMGQAIQRLTAIGGCYFCTNNRFPFGTQFAI
ncbi:MAG: hypothetical protein CM15mP83_7450 [Flavobacteriaceae bacterium]|nr:MAG: hypothetical protein CM15mP83_7450 [Flavobacteriaceae bacterium]